MKKEILEHIEAYLDGDIDRSELEKRADALSEEAIDEKIEWFRNSRTAIETVGLREQLQQVVSDSRQSESKSATIRSIRWKWAVAASILIVAIAYIGINQLREPSLYAQYEYVDPGLPVLMSQSKDHLLYDAMTYYGEENYEVTIDKLRAIQDQYPGNDTISFYLGASLLYSDRPEEAREVLQPVRSDDDSEFTQRAEWLTVLAALKQKKYEQVRGLLADITRSEDHTFFEQAVQLEKELKTEQ